MQDKKLWLVLLLALLSIGANFWGFPIYILDEARNSACAMEMMQRGDWVVPTFNGELRTDKPPLHYFFMIASYKAFGIFPFAARVFSVIMGVLTVWVVYFFVKKLINQRAAFFSALILVSSLAFVIEFHLAVPDPYLVFFLTASWLCFIYAYQSKIKRMYDLSYASMAMAFMAKGPVAVVLSGIIFLLFLLLLEDFSWETLKRLSVLKGVMIFLIITVPWWAAVTVRTDGAWPTRFIMQHNVGRYSLAMEGHNGLPGLPIFFLFASLLPLALYLPGATKSAWGQRKDSLLPFFSLVAASTVVAFFAFSKTILLNYVAPGIPFGAIVIGAFIERRLQNPFPLTVARKTASVLALLVALAVPFALRALISQDKWIYDLPELGWLFLPISMGAIAATIFLFRNQWKESIMSYLLSFWLVGILLFYFAVPAIMAKNPVSGESLRLIDESGREVIGYRKFHDAYVFALQRPLLDFYPIESLKAYIEDKKIIVITRKEHEAELQSIGLETVFEKPYLFENPDLVLMINHP